MQIHKNKRKEAGKITTTKPATNLSNIVTDKSFDVDVTYMMNYLEYDLNSKFMLYRTDTTKMSKNNLYGETIANNKSYLPMVEVFGIIDIANSEMVNYMDSGVIREDLGELVVTVFEKELNAKNIEINRGDIIGINLRQKIRYFEVYDANYVNDSTIQTNNFYQSYHKVITAKPVKTDFFVKP